MYCNCGSTAGCKNCNPTLFISSLPASTHKLYHTCKQSFCFACMSENVEPMITDLQLEIEQLRKEVKALREELKKSR